MSIISVKHDAAYRGCPAIAVEGGGVRVLVLPADGAKLASITAGGREWLAEQPPARAAELGKKRVHYRRLAYGGSYVDAECCGFDDLFPTVDPWTPDDGPFAGEEYPDHGEVCRLAYGATPCPNGVLLGAKSRRFPLVYTKQITGGEEGVTLTYRIENTGDAAFPCLWAGHCLLRGEPGAAVISPYPADAPRTIMFGPGDAAGLPADRLVGYAPGTGPAYKFYYDAPISAGRIGLRLADGRALTFHYDAAVLPYLGVWLNNGAFQQLYTVALEPASLPYDSPGRAGEAGYGGELAPHSALTFAVTIRCEVPSPADWAERSPT